MANLGGLNGVGINLFIDSRNFDRKIKDSITDVKTFSTSFLSAADNMQKTVKASSPLVEQLKNLADVKISGMTEKLLSGKMSTHEFDNTVEGMGLLNAGLKELMFEFSNTGDTDKLNKNLNFLTDKFILATEEGVNTAEMMALNREETEKAGTMIKSGSFQLNNFIKKFSDLRKEHKEGKISTIAYVKELGKSQNIQTFGDAVRLGATAVSKFRWEIAGFIANGAVKAVKFVLGTWIDAFKTIGSAILNTGYAIVSKFIPSLSNMGEAVNSIKDMLLNLNNSFIAATTSGMNLTTGFEARLVALDKEASHLGANMGMVGNDLRKFSGKASAGALALNMSASEYGNAIFSFNKSTEQFKSIGLKNASEVAKVANITGRSAKDMANDLLIMEKSFGITGENANKAVGAWVAFGKEIGDVGVGMKQMEAISTTLNEKSALMFGGQKLKAEELTKFSVSTANFARALAKSSGDMEGSVRIAQDLGKNLVANSKNWKNMFAGTTKDVGDFALHSGIAAGDFNVAMKSMQQGPAEFVAGLADMVAKSKEAGKFNAQSFNFMRGNLEKVFGDATPQVMKFLEESDVATLKLLTSTDGAATSLSKLAKEYKTGYTLADRYNMSVDRFVMKFRDIGRSSATSFVKDVSVEFANLNKKLAETAADGGLLGSLVTKFSEVHQLGAVALLPKTLRPMANAFGTLAQQILPTVQALDAFGISIKDLFTVTGALTAAGGGLITWFAALKTTVNPLTNQFYTTSEAMSTMFDDITDFLEAIPNKIDNFITWIDNFFLELDGGIDGALGGIDWGAKWNRMLGAAEKALSKLGEVFAKLSKGIWDGLSRSFDPNSTEPKSGIERIGNYVGQGLLKAWTYVSDFVIKNVIPKIIDTGRGILDGFNGLDPDVDASPYKSIGNKIGKGLLWMWDNVVVPGAMKLFELIGQFGSGLFGGLIGSIPDENSSEAKKMGNMIGSTIKTALLAAAEAAIQFVQDNPKVAALMAASTGSFAGLAAAAGIGAGAGINSALGLVTGSVADRAKSDFSGAMVKAGRGKGHKEKTDHKMLNLFKNSNISAKTAGFDVGGDAGKVAELENFNKSVTAGAVLQQKSIEQAVSSGNMALAESRRQELAQFIKYADNFDVLVSTYSTKYGKTNAEAYQILKKSLEESTLVGNAEVKKMGDALKGLQITSATVAVGVKDSWIGSFAEIFAKAKEFFEDKAPDLMNKVKNLAPSFLGGNKPKTEGVAKITTASTKMVPTKISTMSQGEADNLFKDPTIKRALGDVAKNMGPGVKKTVEEVLSAAFESAYNKIQKGTVDFTKKLINAEGGFKWLSDNIKNNVTELIFTITTKMQEMAETIRASMFDVTADLNSLVFAMEASNFGKTLVNEYEESQGMSNIQKIEAGVDKNDALYSAIHNPNWVDRYINEFKIEMRLQRENFKELATAIKQNMSSGGSGSQGSSLGKPPSKKGQY